MSKYKYFKIGEEVQDMMGMEVVHDYIIEIHRKKEFYREEFQEYVNEFGKTITSLKLADKFMIFLSKKGIHANYMEYANVVL